jgi:hypothetical protein
VSKTRFRGPRHVSFSGDAKIDALLSAENARDTLEAFDARPPWRFVFVEQYTAAGSTSAKIPLGAVDRPIAVELVRAAIYSDQAVPLSAVGNANFLWDATTTPGTVNAYEPTGLTANTVYTLVFRISEA